LPAIKTQNEVKFTSPVIGGNKDYLYRVHDDFEATRREARFPEVVTVDMPGKH